VNIEPFYAAALGGTLGPIKRWGDMPDAQGMSAEHSARVMHVHFTAPGMSFMASDGEDLAQGTSRRVVLSLGCDTVEDGARVVAALADGGTVDDAYERKFWGQHFGMLYDRFGIIWMVTVLRQAQHDKGSLSMTVMTMGISGW
jgi:PhnB protein